MTRPHILRLRGVWHCGIPGDRDEMFGHGFNPTKALYDWLRLMVNNGRCT